MDSAGRFLFVNQTLAEWLGSTPAEIVGSDARLHDFLAVAAPEGTLPWDPFCGRDDGGQRGEVAFKSRTGRTLQAWLSQSTVGDGAELRTRSVVRDLTPERQWESELRRSRERFQRFFANAPVGIALINRLGGLEEANRALGDLFGAALQALIGEKLIGFVAEEDRRELESRLSEAAEGRMTARPVDIRLTGPRERSCVVFLSRLGGSEGGGGELGQLAITAVIAVVFPCERGGGVCGRSHYGNQGGEEKEGGDWGVHDGKTSAASPFGR